MLKLQSGARLTDRALAHVGGASFAMVLRRLSLTGAPGVGAAGVVALVRGCCGLQGLDLSGCAGALTEESAEAICDSLGLMLQVVQPVCMQCPCDR